MTLSVLCRENPRVQASAVIWPDSSCGRGLGHIFCPCIAVPHSSHVQRERGVTQLLQSTAHVLSLSLHLLMSCHTSRWEEISCQCVVVLKKGTTPAAVSQVTAKHGCHQHLITTIRITVSDRHKIIMHFSRVAVELRLIFKHLCLQKQHFYLL